MSFISLNTHKPMTRELAQQRAKATEAKKTVMANVGQFQKLEGMEDVDRLESPTEVFVPEHAPAELPKSGFQKLSEKLTTPEDGEKKAPATASGFTESDDAGLKMAHDVVINTEGKSEKVNYERFPDGTEVYQAPVDGGYVVVRENSAKGTLFMEVSDEASFGSLLKAKHGEFGAELTPSNDAPAPVTLKESLAQAADAGSTTNSGSYSDGVKQRTEMLKNVASSVGGIFGGMFGLGKKD